MLLSLLTVICMDVGDAVGGPVGRTRPAAYQRGVGGDQCSTLHSNACVHGGSPLQPCPRHDEQQRKRQ